MVRTEMTMTCEEQENTPGHLRGRRLQTSISRFWNITALDSTARLYRIPGSSIADKQSLNALTSSLGWRAVGASACRSLLWNAAGEARVYRFGQDHGPSGQKCRNAVPSAYFRCPRRGARRSISVWITSGNNPLEELEFSCNRLAPGLR